jgi:hypothetical protein
MHLRYILPAKAAFLLLLFSCDNSKSNGGHTMASRDSMIATLMKVTTALEPSLVTDLPFPFRMHFQSENDTFYNLSYSVRYPYSLDQTHQELNAAIAGTIGGEINECKVPPAEQPDYVDMIDHYVVFEGWPVSFDRRHKVVSICFLTQSYYWGAAHYNHYYTALNYDLQKERPLKFSDVFRIKTEKEKLEFCYAVHGGEEKYQFVSKGLRPEHLNEQAKFYFKDKRLVFCFSDYELGPSITEIPVMIEDVKRFLNPEYFP